jgi:di/tricarboxylate transporter
MTFEIGLVLTLLAVAVALFSLERVPVDLVTLGLLAVLVLSRVLTVQQAFAGFGNEIVVILASIFVLSGALMRTGVMDAVGSSIHRVAGGSRVKVLFLIMLVTAAFSAFTNNTTTTAVMIPAAIGLCRRSRISPSQVLMPLAFASILGGALTLIGTSTNVAASAFVSKMGMAPFRMFEFTPVGLVVVAVGLGFLMVVGRHLLPQVADVPAAEHFEIRRYLSEVVVPAGSRLAGEALRFTPLASLDLTVLEIHRGERSFYAGPNGRLAEGDVLIVKASRESLLAIKELAGIEIRSDLELGDRDLITDTIKIVEAIVMPRSGLVGKTIKELTFRNRYGVTVLAVYRKGQTLQAKLGAVELEPGDVLLLQGPSRQFQAIANNPDLWILEEVAHAPLDRRRAAVAVGAFVLALLLGTFELIPVALAFLLGALAVVVAGCLSVEDAYAAIEWPLIVLIAGMTAFGVAMSQTGTGSYLAEQVVHWLAPYGPTVILGGFALLTVVLTQPMSNAAAALVVLPVALATATRLGVNPRTFAVMVTLAASLSFITPFEPSCILVYGPGKYRFRDFLVAGLPLTLVTFVMLMLLVPRFWPL